MSNVVDVLRESVQKDLTDVYKRLVSKESFEDLGFYKVVLSSNPKPYPISGLHHFLGSGFVSARLASFLGLDNYHIVVAFLSGVFHDLHKLGVELEAEKGSIYEKLRKTTLYNNGMLNIVSDEKKAESAFKDALELSLKLWSGDVPRKLQCLADIVSVADVLTGSEESWSLSYAMNTLIKGVSGRESLCRSWIKEENLLPVYIGKQRPLVTMISEQIEEELEKLSAIPLISTPEGMVFLVKDYINTSSIYEKISDFIESAVGEEVEEGPKKEVEIDVSRINDFLSGRRSLATYSKTYTSIAGYSVRTIERTFKKTSLVPADLRLFIVVLAYIYSKDPNKKENEVARIRRYLNNLGMSSIAGKKVGEILVNLYNYLQNIKDPDELREIAEKAKNFIVEEMRKFRTVDTSFLVGKLKMYISVGGTKDWKPERLEKSEGEAIKRCVICRDPVVVGKSLSSYLQELKKDAIRGINISEIFHPDIQGKPERVGSIEDVGELTVCETCYFEAMSYRRIGHTDGLWARVLVYYPAMSIDLMRAVKGAIEEVVEDKVKILTDYMTSRIIITTGNNMLTRDHLEDAIALWYVFGGNLVVTTTAVSSAFAWRGLPVELEVSDVIVEEAVSKYMEVLKNIRKYAWFTNEIRLWLYSLLSTYFSRLEDRAGKNTSIRFSRSMASATGYPTIDVFSLFLKQSKKTERS